MVHLMAGDFTIVELAAVSGRESGELCQKMELAKMLSKSKNNKCQLLPRAYLAHEAIKYNWAG